jgi:hypothetical protein
MGTLKTVKVLVMFGPEVGMLGPWKFPECHFSKHHGVISQADLCRVLSRACPTKRPLLSPSLAASAFRPGGTHILGLGSISTTAQGQKVGVVLP